VAQSLQAGKKGVVSIMKRVLPFVVVIIGAIMFILGRFVLQNHVVNDYLMRIGGVALLVGIFLLIFLRKR
jgi:uncharacterized membrane protein HdeD (DUF308 family)